MARQSKEDEILQQIEEELSGTGKHSEAPAVLELSVLLESSAAKLRSNRLGLGLFILFYALFSVAIFLASWGFGLLFAAVIGILAYFLYLSYKEKKQLYRQLAAGDFCIRCEPVIRKDQEKSGGMITYYFYLEEKRRLNVKRSEYEDLLAGQSLYTLYIGTARTPQLYYPQRRHLLGDSLKPYLENA